MIYEGEPPDNLNIELSYDTDVKFQIESSVELSDDNTNEITVTGTLNGYNAYEVIPVVGFTSEGTSFFDTITSLSFDFEDETNIKIRGITANGDDNCVLMDAYRDIQVRVLNLRWSKTLLEMGIPFDKSLMVYVPKHLTLDNTYVVQLDNENYSIAALTKGETQYELIITRLV